MLYLFRKAGITGTQIAWRDALHEGPVPANLSLEAMSAVRAQYLAARKLGNPIKIIHDFESRDAQFRKAATFHETILWFEHDLYDQLQMLQILTALDEMRLEPGRVAIVQSDHYLGTMTVDELAPLMARRRAVTPATFKSAARAWGRVTSPEPADLYAGAQEDAIGLPFMRAALRRMCEEYPWRDGLSRSQRQALEAVAFGPAPVAELFRRAQSREEAMFLGDSAFERVLNDLRDERAPLLEGETGALVPTALGRQVLAGDADWLEALPIDRWVGGVHLEPEHTVRWNDDMARFVP
ncbi:MAG: hypothetical protein JO199_07220 [Candidatus Eremiobacteraeota bacterium]|nr:hypothetical protein [Candidatus Eremiobacteraeota bacterium]